MFTYLLSEYLNYLNLLYEILQYLLTEVLIRPKGIKLKERPLLLNQSSAKTSEQKYISLICHVHQFISPLSPSFHIIIYKGKEQNYMISKIFWLWDTKFYNLYWEDSCDVPNSCSIIKQGQNVESKDLRGIKWHLKDCK